MEKKNDGELTLNSKERELLHLLREIQYGEVRIIIQAGTPVRIEEIRKSIQLCQVQTFNEKGNLKNVIQEIGEFSSGTCPAGGASARRHARRVRRGCSAYHHGIG